VATDVENELGRREIVQTAARTLAARTAVGSRYRTDGSIFDKAADQPGFALSRNGRFRQSLSNLRYHYGAKLDRDRRVAMPPL